MTDFERFQEYGRLKKIARDADPYSCIYENNKHLYIALSSDQTVRADKFHYMKDSTVFNWLRLLLNIRLGIKQTA